MTAAEVETPVRPRCCDAFESLAAPGQVLWMSAELDENDLAFITISYGESAEAGAQFRVPLLFADRMTDCISAFTEHFRKHRPDSLRMR